MPRYYFHIEDGSSIRDTDGVDLDSFAEAKCAAVKLAGRVICDSAGEFWDRAEWSLTVADERGLTLCTLDVIGTQAPAMQIPASLPPACV
jgi:hypothetical protein